VNNVEGICKQKLRLDSEAVLSGDNQQALAVAVTQLQRSYEEAAAQGGDPPVLDPVADLKLNQLEVVDSVRERQRLMQVCAHLHSWAVQHNTWLLIKSDAARCSLLIFFFCLPALHLHSLAACTPTFTRT
jgi:hypothetical protein